MAVKFKYKKSLYTKQAIKDSGIMTQDEMREEYIRLARYKNARIERLQNRFPRADILKNEDKALSWKEILDKNGRPNMTKLSYEMSSAYRFLNRKNTTITGYTRQLKKAMNSFNKLFPEDENPINENNIFDLFDFLDDYRTRHNTQKIPDSDQIIDIFAQNVEVLNMDWESLKADIDYWREHYDDMYMLKPIESDKPVSSSEYREQLEEKLHNRK